MLPSVRQFCTQFQIYDVSPLINDDLTPKDRCAVVWEAMKVRLPEDAQVRFLQTVCTRCNSPALQCFAAFIQPGMDAAMRDNAIKLMLELDDALGVSMVAYCQENQIKGIPTLVEKFGAESIVYALDVVFPVAGEEMLTALDALKYEANPERFVREQDKLERDFTENFEGSMRVHKENMDKFTQEEQELNRALQHLRPPSPVVESPPMSPTLGPRFRSPVPGSHHPSPVSGSRPQSPVPGSSQHPAARSGHRNKRGRSQSLSREDAATFRKIRDSRKNDP